MIKDYILSETNRLKDNEMIKRNMRRGRAVLLLVFVCVWIISEILYFTSKLMPNQLLVDMVTILFLSEYMVMSTFLADNTKLNLRFVYLMMLAINITLLYFLIIFTGGPHSVFVLLPVLYLMVLFLIDGLLIGMGGLILTLIGFICVYIIFPENNPVYILILIAILLGTVSSGFIYYSTPGIPDTPVESTSPQPGEKITDNNEYNFDKIDHIRSVLTKKEYEILYHIIKGDSNEEISEKLFIEETTIKFHLKNIFKKLNVSNRTDLITSLLSPKTVEKLKQHFDQIRSGTDPLP